jgi:hypothetical protein
MGYELPDPHSPLTKAEELVFGVDAVRHGLLGIPIGHGAGGDAKEQARNFLRSKRDSGQITEAEFQELANKLIAWEDAGNSVNLGSPIMPADHRLHRK